MAADSKRILWKGAISFGLAEMLQRSLKNSKNNKNDAGDAPARKKADTEASGARASAKITRRPPKKIAKFAAKSIAANRKAAPRRKSA